MGIRRLVLLNWVAFAWFFLCGAADTNGQAPVVASQKNAKTVKPSAKQDGVGAQQVKVNKPLDLSVQLKDSEKMAPVTEQNVPAQSGVSELFAAKPKKSPSPLQLKGNLLMSIEPEAEKRKSVDGAGIVIDLKQ